MAANPAIRVKTGGNPNPSVATRFKPGQSGNPSGRPKDLLTQALRQKLTPEKAESLANTLLALAESGDLKAMVEVWDRIEGKAVARQEQGDPGEFARMGAIQDMTPDELRALIKVAGDQKHK